MLFSAISLSFVGLAAALSDESFTLLPWQAAEDGDSRGPCPMLNTLANHGYLPHNGRNLTVHHFADAVTAALNVDPRFGIVPAEAFIKGSGKEYFDLEHLNQPGVLQHPASLTRDDLNAEWSNAKPDAGRVTALLGDSETDHLSVKSMAKTRLRVEALSKPTSLTLKEHALGYIEGSLVLMMMTENPVPSAFSFSSSKVWAAPKDRVSTWLIEERLPEELGWKRSERLIKSVDLVPLMASVFYEYWAISATALWQSWTAPVFGGKEEL